MKLHAATQELLEICKGTRGEGLAIQISELVNLKDAWTEQEEYVECYNETRKLVRALLLQIVTLGT